MKTSFPKLLAGLAAFLFALIIGPNAIAAPGDLDTSFGNGGKVVTAIGNGSDQGSRIALQADGKIVVAGNSFNGSNTDFSIVRYNADGTLDTTFNGTGKVTTPIGSGNDYAQSVAVQIDGKIVVAGRSSNGSNDDFSVARYNTNGSLDTTFNGTGKLSTAIGSSDDGATGVAVQTDGRIVAGGYSTFEPGRSHFALARYNINGSLDSTFNGSGKVVTAIDSYNDQIQSVKIQGDGKILAVGYSANGFTPYDSALARYNANGTLDTSFNGIGKVITDVGGGHNFSNGIALQTDGKTIVVGHTSVGNGDFSVIRYNANGSLDTSFNGTGKVSTPIGPIDEIAYDVAVQTDGKIVVAGYSSNGSNTDFALVRYNTNGTLDTTFNGTGKITTAIGTGNEAGRGVVVQSDGKIVVAGYSSNGSNDDFAVVRYLGDGPKVTSVFPNPVTGSNSPQTFVINGTNFDANCTVNLRNLSTGIPYLNRPKSAQTATTITLNPNFGTPAHTWSVEVINPGNISSGQYQFSVTSPASLVSLTVTGPPSVSAGSGAPFMATASFSNTTTLDVSKQATWSVTGGTSGTEMIGHYLFAEAGPVSVAQVRATWSPTTGAGTRTGTANVAVGGGVNVSLNRPFSLFDSRSGNTVSYRLQTSPWISGATGDVSSVWTWNGAPIPGQTGASLNGIVTGVPGTGTLSVTVTDSIGESGSAEIQVTLDKPPVSSEPIPTIRPPVSLLHPLSGFSGSLYSTDGASAYHSAEAKKGNGFVVIVHGLNDRVEAPGSPQVNPPGDDVPAGWMARMGQAIETQLSGSGVPNILLYDWEKGANPSGYLGLDDRHNYLVEARKEASGYTGEILGAATIPFDKEIITAQWAADIVAVRGNATRQGKALHAWMVPRILSGEIIASKPIHLIGHSAGGFVVGECAKRLLSDSRLQGIYEPSQLQVTMLDTPFPLRGHVSDVKDPGKVERYVSSVLGVLAPQLALVEDTRVVRNIFLPSSTANSTPLAILPTTPIVVQDAYYFVSGIPAAMPNEIAGFRQNHSEAHEWYIRTIQNPTGYGTGFYYSPLLDHSWSSPMLSGLRASTNASQAGLRFEAANASELISGFTTFGNVSANGGSYTIGEQDNAGLAKSVTIPIGAEGLTFRLQFSQAGDGDFVEVSFGDHPPLEIIEDDELLRQGFVDFEVSVSQYAGETGTLLFKLVSRGQPNAQVLLDQIALTISDDPDYDGLTNAQEAALGTRANSYDTDGDGLSDAVEVNVYLTNPLLADTDGDGSSDADEITAGTNPLDPKSNFKVVATQRLPNGSFALSWPATVGISYRVLRSPTPDFASFDVLAVGLEPATTLATYTDSTLPPGTPAAFYRVTTEP